MTGEKTTDGAWAAVGSAIAAAVVVLSGMIYAWHYYGSTATAVTGLGLACITYPLAIKSWLGTVLELGALSTGAALIISGVVVDRPSRFILGVMIGSPIAAVWLTRRRNTGRPWRIY